MDILGLVNEKRQEMQALFARMDSDRDLLLQKTYVMRDEYGHKMPGVHNVTLPYPSIYFNRILALVGSAIEQINVTSETMTPTQTSRIEKFIEDLFYEVDSRLSKQALPSMAGVQWERIAGRGWLVSRCCLRENDDGLVADILPIDSRNVLYESGESLIWAANETRRSRAAVEQEYGIQVASKLATVTDFWDEKQNEVYIDGEKVLEQDNIYGYVPFVIHAGINGSLLAEGVNDYASTEGFSGYKYRGESVFHLARNIFIELNRFGSMVSTLTQLAFNNNLQYASKQGELATPPDAPELDNQIVYPVDIGGGFKGMPIEDTHRAAQMWFNMLNELLQMATISSANYGVLNFPLSGVAIASMMESRDKILIPLLQGYSLHKRALAEMAIKQIVEMKIKATVGQQGQKHEYETAMFKGDYSIGFRFFARTKEDQIASATVANAMGNMVSNSYKREEIFQLQHPDDEKRQVQYEQLEATHPLISRWNQIVYLYEADDKNKELQGDILLEELLDLIRGGQIGNMPTGEASGSPGESLLPMLESGGTASRPPKQEAGIE